MRHLVKTRAYNFGAGPAMLPVEILQEAQDELLNWQGQGMSIMEIGHRTSQFKVLLESIEADLRTLLSIPKDFHVLFLGGAARTQFAMIPMNLLSAKDQAGYLISGIWSAQAYKEALKLSQAYCVASTESTGFTEAPHPSEWNLQDHTRYLYYTPNETINGVRFPQVPKIKHTALIADMTSCLLSEPIQIEDYDLIFAGAQKNIANAGMTIVIIRQSLLDESMPKMIPTMMDYKTHVEEQSLYATPPTFNCYLAGKMFKWLLNQGGVDAVYAQNRLKAEALYQYIDQSTAYECKIEPSARSLMNVCFHLKDSKQEQVFLEKAASQGLLALRGHRLVGGLRASLYNAMPLAGVEALIQFMQAFAKE